MKWNRRHKRGHQTSRQCCLGVENEYLADNVKRHGSSVSVAEQLIFACAHFSSMPVQHPAGGHQQLCGLLSVQQNFLLGLRGPKKHRQHSLLASLPKRSPVKPCGGQHLRTMSKQPAAVLYRSALRGWSDRSSSRCSVKPMRSGCWWQASSSLQS